MLQCARYRGKNAQAKRFTYLPAHPAHAFSYMVWTTCRHSHKSSPYRRSGSSAKASISVPPAFLRGSKASAAVSSASWSAINASRSSSVARASCMPCLKASCIPQVAKIVARPACRASSSSLFQRQQGVSKHFQWFKARTGTTGESDLVSKRYDMSASSRGIPRAASFTMVQGAPASPLHRQC